MYTENINYKSADLEIYPDLGQVNVANKTIRLGPVTMRVLVLLLENNQRVVSRSELFDSVWKNQVVSDDVLTRCISDIRTLFNKYSKQNKLIRTIPKRGYQWQPSVTKLDKVNKEKLDSTKKKTSIIYFIIATIIGMPILSTIVLWIANLMVHPNQVKVALTPIQTNEISHQTVALEIEDLLKSKILKTKNLRFLSSKAISRHLSNPYPYLFRELGTQWIVEGEIRLYNGKTRVSLSLVDARTAMVFHTAITDIEKGTNQIEDFSELFIHDMLRLLE